jgi:7-cyano-7-deazaguanine synthase
MKKTELSTRPDADRSLFGHSGSLGVLSSGGVDSAVLLGEAVHHAPKVFPLYVRSGLFWETVELNHLHYYLEALGHPGLQPLQILDMPVGDLYQNHWSITGRDVPDGTSPDAAVFLPGRNVLLMAKTLVWCHLHQVAEVALGLLASNPFPDATSTFFTAYQNAVNVAIGGMVQIHRPLASLTKKEVIRRGRHLPLELTFSCIRPISGKHCGNCNKCAERRKAFAEAGLTDTTQYHSGDLCTA